MKYCIILKAFLTSLLVFVSLPVSAETQSCRSHIDLVNQVDFFETDTPPCDMIGGLFLLPFEARTSEASISLPHGDTNDYPYYVAARRYLEFSERSVPSVANLSILISAVSLMEYGSEVSEKRKKIYSAYVLSQYLIGNSAEIEAYVKGNELDGRSVSGFAEFSFDFLREEFPEVSTEALKCFIKLDIPTLLVSEVFESSGYRVCIEE